MNFVDLLDEHRIPYSVAGPKTRAGWVNMRCIYCGKDPYMGYSLDSRAINCWNCGTHPLWEVIHFLTGMPKPQVFDLIGQIPRADFVKSLYENHTGKLKLPETEPFLLEAHRIYLRGRGLLPSKIVNIWDVKALGPLAGKYRWRLFIPVYMGGDVVTWTTRSINNECPHAFRYFSAPDEDSAVPISDTVYGMDYARGSSIIIVEGPIDAWAIGPGAVALCGMTDTPARFEQLSRFANRVICFDDEPDAQRNARRLAGELAVFPGTTVNVVLETGKDAASARKEELEELRREFLSPV